MAEVLVLFNYDAQADDELTIRKGDVILDVNKTDGGWWEGQLGSKRGVFPDNFVTVVTEAEMNNPRHSSIIRADKGRRCKALFSYSPSHEDELSLAVGDEIQWLGEVEEGWWRGKLAGKVGVFPSNFVMMVDEPATANPVVKDSLSVTPSSNHSSTDPPAPELPPKPVREMARVLFPYTALQADELDLREGDLIIIHSKDCEDKGWWKGEFNNKIGVFPDNFVQLLVSNSNGGTTTKPERPPPVSSLSSSATPQIRNSINGTSESTSRSPTSESSADPRSPIDRKAIIAAYHAGFTPQPQPSSSLSDEQKLQRVGGEEVDYSHVISPTEVLSNPTASRVKPAKRRPPSGVIIKEEFGLNGNEHPENGGGGLPVQPEEVEDQAEQQPVTKTRTAPVKPPWMEELKRNQEKRGSSMVTQDKPVVPPAKPALAKPTPASIPNNTAVKTVLAEPPSARKATLPTTSPVGAKQNVITGTGNNGSPVGASNKQAINEPGVMILLKQSTGTVSQETVTNKIATQPTTVIRQSSEPSSNTTTGLAASPLVMNRTSNSENVQQEIQSLRLRVVTLEATVQNLQEVVEKLKKTIDDDRIAKTNGASSNTTPLIRI